MRLLTILLVLLGTGTARLSAQLLELPLRDQGCGFFPNPCARTDLAVTKDSHGNNSNGTPPFTGTWGPVNQVALDPFFGERMVRVTNGYSNNNVPDAWVDADEGWLKSFNCAGTTRGTCSGSIHMLLASDQTSSGYAEVFAFDPRTLNITRVDGTGGFTAPPTEFILQDASFSGVNPNLIYASTQSGEDTADSANLATWMFTPPKQSSPTPAILVNINAGPLSTGPNQDANANGATFLNGRLNYQSAWPPLANSCGGATNSCPPTVQTATCGSTPNCIQVSATGGTMGSSSTTFGSPANRVWFAMTEDDDLTEQNFVGLSGAGWASTYIFSGGTGSIVAVNGPTQITGGITAVHWNLYVGGSNAASLTNRQIQVAYPTTMSGRMTSYNPVVSASHPLNYTCSPVGVGIGSGRCGIGTFNVSNDDKTIAIETGGVQQDAYEIVAIWDSTRGGRWLDLSTGTIYNGSTDAAGVSCGIASDCWTSIGTGAMTYLGDPNDPFFSSGQNQTYQGAMVHNIALDGSGTQVLIELNPTGYWGTADTYLWTIATGTVWECSTFGNGTFGSCGTPHHGVGYQSYVRGDPYCEIIDCSFDLRYSNTSTAAGFQVFPTAANAAVTNIPSPTGPGAGAGRQDSHVSYVNADSLNTMPWTFWPYMQYLSCGVSSVSRGSTGLVNFTVSGNCTYSSFMPGDSVTFSNVDPTINGSCLMNGTYTAGSSTATCEQRGGSTGTFTSGTVTKTDARPARAWENEVLGISTDGTNRVFRFFHNYSDMHYGNPFNLEPRGHVSQDGHFAMWTTDFLSGVGLVSVAYPGSTTSEPLNQVIYTCAAQLNCNNYAVITTAGTTGGTEPYPPGSWPASGTAVPDGTAIWTVVKGCNDVNLPLAAQASCRTEVVLGELR